MLKTWDSKCIELETLLNCHLWVSTKFTINHCCRTGGIVKIYFGFISPCRDAMLSY